MHLWEYVCITVCFCMTFAIGFFSHLHSESCFLPNVICLQQDTCKFKPELNLSDLQLQIWQNVYDLDFKKNHLWLRSNKKPNIYINYRVSSCSFFLITPLNHLQDLLCRSQILRVLSWLPETTLKLSPRNLAARTFPLWPVSVCCKLQINN